MLIKGIIIELYCKAFLFKGIFKNSKINRLQIF